MVNREVLMKLKQKLKNLIRDLGLAQGAPDGPVKTNNIEAFFKAVDELDLKSAMKKGDLYIRHDNCNKGRCTHEFGYSNKAEGINIWILLTSIDDEYSFLCFDSNFTQDE